MTSDIDSVKDKMLIADAQAKLKFMETKARARESVEIAAREYVRIINQIAEARDKAQQVLTEERIASLMAAAEQARWNAAQSIIDQERLRLELFLNKSRAKGAYTKCNSFTVKKQRGK